MKKYLLLVDDEWYTATLSEEDVIKIKKDIEGISFGSEYNIKLDNGDIVDIGIIDSIKYYPKAY